jgi:hypothetical protein
MFQFNVSLLVMFISVKKYTVNKNKLHMLHPPCYSCYQPCEQSRMKKGLDCDYETLNITMVICDTYILQR